MMTKTVVRYLAICWFALAWHPDGELIIGLGGNESKPWTLDRL